LWSSCKLIRLSYIDGASHDALGYTAQYPPKTLPSMLRYTIYSRVEVEFACRCRPGMLCPDMKQCSTSLSALLLSVAQSHDVPEQRQKPIQTIIKVTKVKKSGDDTKMYKVSSSQKHPSRESVVSCTKSHIHSSSSATLQIDPTRRIQ
jgi:hypothetical protein